MDQCNPRQYKWFPLPRELVRDTAETLAGILSPKVARCARSQVSWECPGSLTIKSLRIAGQGQSLRVRKFRGGLLKFPRAEDEMQLKSRAALPSTILV